MVFPSSRKCEIRQQRNVASPLSLRTCNIMLAHDAVDRRKLGFFKQKFGASLEQF